MVEKVKEILRRRHFWRTIGFDELGELYASQMLRALAVSIVGIFVPVYLYTIGYSIQSIFGMYLMWITLRPFFSVITAHCIARFGPKHTIALGTVVHIVYMVILLTIQDLHWPIICVSIAGSLGYALFNNAYEVDFSKIKHTDHGGKELGYAQVFERIGAILGPIIGGLLATVFDPRYTIVAAICVFSASLVPIFLSAEPTKTRQRIVFRGFPFRRHTNDFLSTGFLAVENTVSIVIWPLFIAVTIFTVKPFAALGLLSAVSTIAALLAVFAIGKLIDRRQGGALLNFGAISNAVVHLFRPFATSALQVLAINVVNEPMTASYRMPYLKGRYDAADSVPGYRIVYITLNDFALAAANFMFWLFMWSACFYINPVTVMQISFVIASVASLGIMTQKFIALRV